MNLFMTIPLLLVVTTGLWEQTMAQENTTEQTLDTGNHHVMKVSMYMQVQSVVMEQTPLRPTVTNNAQM